MLARHVMTRPVVTLRPNLPVRAAVALVVGNGFTSAPVVDAEGRLSGLVSESDPIRAELAGTSGRPVEPLRVRQLMTPATRIMAPDDPLEDVVELLLSSEVRSVPIVDRGKLVGLITRHDVLRAVADGTLPPADAQAIRNTPVGTPR